MFDAESIRNLPADDDEAILHVCDAVLRLYLGKVKSHPGKYYDELADVLAFFIVFAQSRSLKYNFPNLDANQAVVSERAVIEFLKKQANEARARRKRKVGEEEFLRFQEKYAAMFSGGLLHEFTESDISRIQELINELRGLITDASGLEENHRGRLLRRLEKLQAELHKKVPDLDRFYGLVGDAFEVVGKLGKDAKPLVDRFREILELVWKAQARVAQLPLTSLKKLLTFEEDEDPECGVAAAQESDGRAG